MATYFEDYNAATGHSLPDEFNENLTTLAKIDGRSISAELMWLVEREILRRKMELDRIDGEIKELRRKFEEINQRVCVQQAVNEEMRRLATSTADCVEQKLKSKNKAWE